MSTYLKETIGRRRFGGGLWLGEATSTFFSSKARAKIRTGQPTITNGNDGMMGFTQDSFKRKKHVRRINNGKKWA